MDKYDESGDIDILLRSALRGKQANASAGTAAGGQSACLEESATRRRRISDLAAMPSTSSIHCQKKLIPISEFTLELYEWGPNKTKTTTMVKLPDAYALIRPTIITMLMSVTTASGPEARVLIDDAKQAIFGGYTVHDICV